MQDTVDYSITLVKRIDRSGVSLITTEASGVTNQTGTGVTQATAITNFDTIVTAGLDTYTYS